MKNLASTKNAGKIWLLTEIASFLPDPRVTFFGNSTQVCGGSNGSLDITVSQIDGFGQSGYTLTVNIANRYQYKSAKVYSTLSEARNVHDGIVEKALLILDNNVGYEEDFSVAETMRPLEVFLLTHGFAYIAKVSDISMTVLG